MSYKCSQCGYSSEQPGNCPTCNVALAEVKKEGDSQGTAQQDSSSTEKSGQPTSNPAA